MAVSSVLAFWAVAVLLVLVPGPDWAFTLSAGLRGQVIAAAIGIVLGYVGMTAVVAAGVGVLVASSPEALTLLTVIGGAYLIWLGAKIVAHPSSPMGTDGSVVETSRATVAQGVAVSGLNPKALLVFVALLPQFTDPDGALPIPVQIGVLGLAFTLTCGVVYLVVGLLARSVLHGRPAAAHAVSRLSGGAMLLLGAVLLIERVTS